MGKDELGEIGEGMMKMYKGIERRGCEEDVVKGEVRENIGEEVKSGVGSMEGYVERIVENGDMKEEMKWEFVEGCYGEREGVRCVVGEMCRVKGLDEGWDMVDLEGVEIREMVSEIGGERGVERE